MSIFVDIEKSIGNFQLAVTFEAQNEVLALLGASGSGKSLTLKCIAGIEKPDKGKIILNGRTLFDSQKKVNLPVQKRKTGYLFQNYALFPNMTVENNITAGICASKSKRKSIALEWIETFQLKGLETYYPAQISGEQQQRVALARLLASEPDILMLDEPFSSLDNYLRWQMEQEIRLILQKFKGTALFVSHNQNQVYSLSDRIAVLSNGRLELIKEKGALFESPKTLNATLLTGCKNISRAQRLSDFTLKALDWNTILTTERKIENTVRYVGIREYSFTYTKNPNENNVFKGKIVHVAEGVFSVVAVIQCEGTQSAQSCIRWELGKKSYQELTENSESIYPKVQPNDILLISN